MKNHKEILLRSSISIVNIDDDGCIYQINLINLLFIWFKLRLLTLGSFTWLTYESFTMRLLTTGIVTRRFNIIPQYDHILAASTLHKKSWHQYRTTDLLAMDKRKIFAAGRVQSQRVSIFFKFIFTRKNRFLNNWPISWQNQ